MAGESRLTVEAVSNNKPVLCEIQPGENLGHHKITFTPTELNDVTLKVFYGGYRIPGRHLTNLLRINILKTFRSVRFALLVKWSFYLSLYIYICTHTHARATTLIYEYTKDVSKDLTFRWPLILVILAEIISNFHRNELKQIETLYLMEEDSTCLSQWESTRKRWIGCGGDEDNFLIKRHCSHWICPSGISFVGTYECIGICPTSSR